MKVGSVLKLKGPPRPDFFLEKHGWLWVYEGKGGLGWHMFRSVASGSIENARYPQRVFENWEDEDEAKEG